MKILVAYFSESGNTERIAKAIYEEVVASQTVHLKNISEITSDDLDRYDLVFLGSACHDANLAVPVLRILEGIKKPPSFKIAGFVTHATVMPEGSGRNQELYSEWAGRCSETLEKASLEKGFDLLGYFHCQGAPSTPIEEFIHSEIISAENEWKEYVDEVRKHPDEKDLENAKVFAKHILLKIMQGEDIA